MRLCGICDRSRADLREEGEKLVQCAVCAETVCTATCSEVVTDEDGNDVHLCSDCYIRELKKIAASSR